jgi:hypothetical protein
VNDVLLHYNQQSPQQQLLSTWSTPNKLEKRIVNTPGLKTPRFVQIIAACGSIQSDEDDESTADDPGLPPSDVNVFWEIVMLSYQSEGREIRKQLEAIHASERIATSSRLRIPKRVQIVFAYELMPQQRQSHYHSLPSLVLPLSHCLPLAAAAAGGDASDYDCNDIDNSRHTELELLPSTHISSTWTPFNSRGKNDVTAASLPVRTILCVTGLLVIYYTVVLYYFIYVVKKFD